MTDNARCVVRPMLPALEPLAREVYTALGPESVGWADGGFGLPAGCAAAVVRIVEEHRRRCRVLDRRPPGPDSAPDAAVLAAAGGADRRLFDALAGNRLGLLDLGPGVHTFAGIAQVYRLFPTAQVVVAVRGRAAVGGYARGLADWLDAPVGRVTGTRAEVRRRLVVVDDAVLESWTPSERAVLVVPEADRDPAAAYRVLSLAARCVRAFAFAREVNFSNRAGLTAAFGDVAFAPAGAGGGVQVFILPSPPVPLALPKTPTMLAFKRAAFWRNKPRLRAAAGVAAAAHAGDLATLRGYGLRFDAAELPAPAGGRRVAVVVENADQGRGFNACCPSGLSSPTTRSPTHSPVPGARAGDRGDHGRGPGPGRGRRAGAGGRRVGRTPGGRVPAGGAVRPGLGGGRHRLRGRVESTPRRYAHLRQRDYLRAGYVVTPC